MWESCESLQVCETRRLPRIVCQRVISGESGWGRKGAAGIFRCHTSNTNLKWTPLWVWIRDTIVKTHTWCWWALSTANDMESGQRTGVWFTSGHTHTRKIWVKFGWNVLSVGKKWNFSPVTVLMTKQRSSKQPKDQQKPRQLNQEQELALWFTRKATVKTQLSKIALIQKIPLDTLGLLVAKQIQFLVQKVPM